ncbi:hypothetical protein JCM9279_003004 [Rhodotorula babjevae]
MQQTSQLAARLDSLPNELLLNILAHLPPPRISLGSASAPSQRNELFAVQLTSKRLKDLCTPTLWERLEMDIGPAGRGETSRVVGQLRASQERARACRKLRLEAFDWGFLPPFDGPGERLLPNVEELGMRETMPITLDVVARFEQLRHLNIEYAELLPPSSQVVFANLERMSLAAVTVRLPPSRSASFFDTSNVPTLRQVSLGPMFVDRPTRDDEDDDNAAGAAVFSPALVRSLDQLHLELESVHTHCDGVVPVETLGPDAPVLWHAELGARAPPFFGLFPPAVPLAFLYITLSDDRSDGTTVPQLRRLIAAHPFLRLVLVPLEFWRAAPRTSRPGADGPDAASASASFEAVVAECAARGLAVRPYDAGREREGFVPREAVQFWREEGVGRT